MSQTDHVHNSLSAPEDIVYCVRCGEMLETREFAGKPRRICPACGYIHFIDPKVGVGILLVEDGAILLVRRTMEPERGKWAIPAGFLDHGEDPEAAAVREAFEETGLRVAIKGLVDVFFNPPDQGGASIFILYRAKRVGGELEPGEDANAVGFFAKNDLPKIAFSSTRAAIDQLP